VKGAVGKGTGSEIACRGGDKRELLKDSTKRGRRAGVRASG